jgi:hypothetical protein
MSKKITERRSSPEYKVWNNFKTRCYNPNTINYNRYGGRGIIVCDKWLSFEGFLEDMGKRPSNDYSLDRIDNDGNYCKDNCRWVTRKEQTRNRSSNIYVLYKENKIILKDLAKEVGLDYQVIKRRLDKGLDITIAISKDLKYVRL